MDTEEYSEKFRFCRVCLVPEEDEIFSSVFDNNAKIAHKLHNLTGIYPVDVDEKVPSLICIRCLREVAAADLVRKRILDANEHLSMMTAEKEIKLFKKELKQLRSADSNKENKSAEDFVRREIYDSSSEEFYIPRVFIDRNKKCEELVAEIVNKKTKAVKRKTSKTSRSKVQKKSLTSRTTKERNKTRKVDGPKKKRRVKITPRRKVPITFECDTCKDCFMSHEELNDHMDIHNCKLISIFI